MKINVIEDKLMEQGNPAILLLSTTDYNYYIRNMPMESHEEKIKEIFRVIGKDRKL